MTTPLLASPAEAGEAASSSDARTGGDTPGEPQASGVERALREAIDRLPAEAALTVASCRIENGAALRASSPAEAEQAAQRTEEALRGHVRPGDEVWRTGADSFALLLPDPGPAPTDRLAHLARAVADQVTRAASGSAPRAVLAFGYALHPTDGDSPEALLDRAAAPRIRML